MSRKIVVVDEQVTKVAYSTVALFNNEEQKRITVTLECGDRIVMREGEALFQSVGLYLKQGDVLTFTADDYDVNRFKMGDNQEREIALKELRAVKDLTVVAGAWSDRPVEALADRPAATNFTPPRAKTAAPVSGAGQFSAPAETATGAAPVVPATGAAY